MGNCDCPIFPFILKYQVMSRYSFESLSSLDFEELACDLLQKEWGKTLEIFKPGKDQGIDIRAIETDSNTIVQCKHYVGSGFQTLLRNLKNEELPKIKKLAPERYVVATSVPLSPLNKTAIRKACAPYILSDADVLGQ